MAGKKGRSGRPRKYPKPVEKTPVQELKKPQVVTKPAKPMVLPSASVGSVAHEIQNHATESGIDGLKRLQDEVSGGPKPDGASGPVDTAGAQPNAEAADPKGRAKFKTYRPEQTVKIVVRQYWRFRDWMTRRQLGLPSDYAGIFIQKEDGLVAPLVEPLVGCIDAYCPEEWIVFIEEKSPIIHLFLAVFEVEQVFQSAVNDVRMELKKTSNQKKSDEPVKPKFPSLSETQGK